MTKMTPMPGDAHLAELEEEYYRREAAALLLKLPDQSPYRDREYELGMLIREYKEIMRS